MLSRRAPAANVHSLGYPGGNFSLSTIRQSSARVEALTFRIPLLRWTFTVVSAMSPAICLFSRPAAT